MAKFYEVGGAIRDELMGKTSKDVDWAVETESFEAMKAAVVSKGFKIVTEHPQFVTLKAKTPTGVQDFTLCRKDGEYKDGRHPEKVEGGTILDDLKRRDFTINAIARGEDGKLLDPHGGQRDIELRRIACVGEPRARFGEDGLRMLRALRFSVTKACFLDFEIEKLLRDRPFFEQKLKNVSTDRVRVELDHMFRCDTFFTLHLLGSYPDLMKYIFYKAAIWLKPTVEAR